MRVSELIGEDGKWKLDTLQDLFPINEVHRIKHILIGRVKDRDVWAFNNSGEYTVKSECWLLTNMPERNGGTSVVQEQDVLDLKRKIWKIPTIPKICMFLWRAASGALAVAERLTAHGVETIRHVLFQCVKAQELLDELRVAPDQLLQDVSLIELLKESLRLIIQETLEKERRKAVPWILWMIWKTGTKAMEEATLWYELNKSPYGELITTNDLGIPRRWVAPTQGVVKCNFYASWRSNRHLTGGAWITRDYRGMVGMHARDALIPTPERLSAEMQCLLWRVCIGTESNMLTEAIRKFSKWPRYRSLLQSISAVCLEFTSIEFEIESRTSNKVAREISTSVLRDGRFRLYLAMGGPSWLHDLIQTEASI
ncbi:hypothetical protein Bca52824_011064 [Brassica carinata]|uniref:RNase H type-1 domain-containing protein n=1 Tax=Brassica carinata TaxID=52824 RepID=A0A8X7WDY1_BRACI|nr:hypothetical protein Bca52824_011064 [Brassica carinata]